MGRKSRRISASAIWRLAENQHGVVTRGQLLSAGLSSDAIDSRIASGRLHRTWRGVYALGRPELTRHGWWMAAVLACGDHAVLSHDSAAGLWGIRAMKGGLTPEGRPPAVIHLSLPGSASRLRKGVRVHRRSHLSTADSTRRNGIPVTSPALTLIDLGSRLTVAQVEAAVNEADKLGLIDPDALRAAVDEHRGLRGVALLRRLLDRSSYVMTDTELERRFLPIVKRAGLPLPLTQEHVNGFRVDFFWPQLGLVVETDGLTYHRTPSQQAKDRVRDQSHLAAGLTSLRFTHAQVRFEAGKVASVLRATAEQCRWRIVGSPGR